MAQGKILRAGQIDQKDRAPMPKSRDPYRGTAGLHALLCSLAHRTWLLPTMVVVGADAHLSPTQLSSVAASTPGRLSIAGYASLMDEASARETMPSMSGFRYGVVDGYCRIFNLVSIVNIRKGLATGRRLATCTALMMRRAGTAEGHMHRTRTESVWLLLAMAHCCLCKPSQN